MSTLAQAFAAFQLYLSQIDSQGTLTIDDLTVGSFCPNPVVASNTVAAAGRAHCFDRGTGPQFRLDCDFGVTSVTSEGPPGNEHTITLAVPVECALIKLTMWCPGQYSEVQPLATLSPAIPLVGAPGQVQANMVSTNLFAEAPVGCVDTFTFKTHIAKEDGSFAPYTIVAPVELTPGSDLVYDFCIFGCPCEPTPV